MEAFLDDGKAKHPLTTAVTILGRDRRTCTLVFEDELISRRHAYVVRQGEGIYAVLDMNSSNGVQVNGRPVDHRVLQDGDLISLGGVKLTFRVAKPAPAPVAAPVSAPGARSHAAADADRQMISKKKTSAEFVRVLREDTLAVPGVRKKALHSDFDKLLILYKVGRLVSSETDLDKLLSKVVDLAMEVLDADRVSIMFRTAEGLVAKVQRARDREQFESGLVEISKSISEFCLSKNEAIITQDALVDGRFQKSGSIQMFNIRSAMCSPLSNKDEPFGVIYVDNRIHGDSFTEDDLKLLEAFADSVSIAIVNSRLIHELKKSLAQLKQQQEALIQHEKLAAMGQLSAGIAHEVRGPLTAISGYVQYYFAKFPPGSPFYEKMQRIEDSLESINGIVEGLLDVARKGEGRRERVSLAAVLESTLKVAEHALIKLGNIKLVKDVTPDLPPCHADRRQLQQVFLNMVVNGGQAMPQGGTLTLTVRAGPKKSDGRPTVEVVFADTGVGMSPEVRAQIFHPFFTKGKKGGTGLGLSISKSIIDAHGGEIALESELGKGTTFTLRFPAMTPAEIQNPPPSIAGPSPEDAVGKALSDSIGEIPVVAPDTKPDLNLKALAGQGPSVSSTPSGGVLISNLTSDPEDKGR